MGDIVSRLEDHVTSTKQKTIPIIDFENNESLRGLDYLDTIYHAAVNKQVLKYRSFKKTLSQYFFILPLSVKGILEPKVCIWLSKRKPDQFAIVNYYLKD